MSMDDCDCDCCSHEGQGSSRHNPEALATEINTLRMAALALLASLPPIPRCGHPYDLSPYCKAPGTHMISLNRTRLYCEPCGRIQLAYRADRDEEIWQQYGHEHAQNPLRILQDPTERVAALRAEVPQPDPQVAARLALEALLRPASG